MRKILFILGQLTDEDADWLGRSGQVVKVDAGTTIIEKGKNIEDIYIVLEGMLGVFQHAGTSARLAKLRTGEIVGEMSFIDSSPPSATVLAEENSLVLRVSKAALQTRLESDHAFAARFYRSTAMLLSDRLRKANAQLAMLRGEPVEEGSLEEDELDPNVLDSVSLAGGRFERILKKLRKGGYPSPS
jgi:CRP/FNR family transcriptional regulator, cyclic AMP receptor protein